VLLKPELVDDLKFVAGQHDLKSFASRIGCHFYLSPNRTAFLRSRIGLQAQCRLLGGAGAGIFAAILSGLISGWKFLPPNTASLHFTLAEEVNLLTFVFASLLIVWAADHYRSLTKRLEDEEKFRKLAVEELGHRLKNKLATIQAIIGFRLREHPNVKDTIIRSLSALSATDDLIMASQGRLGPDPRRALGPAATPAASTGRTRDRTRPMLQKRQKSSCNGAVHT